MKTFIAEEGKVFKNREDVLGNIVYTPDDFDESNLGFSLSDGYLILEVN